MGPTPITYLHPWIKPDSTVWDVEDGSKYCTTYYRYPEVPSFGFYVQSFDLNFFYVGPIKWEDGIPSRSGTAYYINTQDKVTEVVDGMYVKGLGMHKVHNIEDLVDIELAPF